MDPIQTERLILRPWTQADLTDMAALNADKEVMQFFPYCPDENQTAAFIERMIVQCNKQSYCYFATELKETKEFIGFIGIMDQDYIPGLPPLVDIGWRLKKEAWGKGYATEGALASLHYGFNTMKLNQIYSVASKVNIPSLRVMEKIGMSWIDDFSHPKLLDYESIKVCDLYQITHSEYNHQKS